ncbi:MAG: D-alanyl-D-alanine endopeptidase [Burkholderiaceae bacterium]|jgi:serine-type D-Ala-D-Ala endopeptidase (penicillin-binding protein 7)|nr:D-alanyl-D-alanine endopeptidase [Burkholderiaceae bacterium]MDP4969439.1 D-alanyl-D-alanine endopeptidase [Burkholderiaceae bacterium]MDP5111461.1 D-alanyl-D-alanine endopeptidase [Burkholderiaceae bacterium]
MRLAIFSPFRNALISGLVCLSLALAGGVSFAQSTKPSSTQASKSKPAQAKKNTHRASTAKKKTASKAKPKAKSSANTKKKKAAPAGTPQGTRGVKSTSNSRKALAAGATTAAVATAASAKRAEAEQKSGNPSSGLRSNVVFVQDLSSKTVLFSRNDEVARPIASITKLMTALIVVDAKQPLDEMLQITQADVDVVKFSRSRLAVGQRLSRGDMLHLALMSSENRAANALGRHYPGGMPAFVAAMNNKARELGMNNSRFVEPTGLSSGNVATPRDLVKLMQATAARPSIRYYTTNQQHEISARGHATLFRNTNRLVTNPNWDIKVSKTGFINEAGQCLVMVARINNRDTAIVLLNADGKGTRIGDAVKIRQLVQNRQAVAMSNPRVN